MTQGMTGSRIQPALAAFLFTIFCAGPAGADIQLPQPDGSMLVLDKPATRIVSLAPNVAEILFAAGAGDLLVATVDYSDYPAEAAALPRIGDAFRFDLERIFDYRPDLVIGWETGNPAAALQALEDLGLNVWRTEVRAPDDIARLLEWAGEATGRRQPAAKAAGSVRARLRALRQLNGGKSQLSYFYQVAEKPLYTVNGQHLISQGLAICGAVNAFANLAVLAPQISVEAVLQADPEVLIAPALPGQTDPLEHWRTWPRLRAVRDGRTMLLPADEISRATPRILDSVEQACMVLDGFRQASQ